MSSAYDVVVVGGGPAGCAAAITLARARRRVLLLEAGRYPRQKVCGEFVSAEALPVLSELLGADAELLASAPAIDCVRFRLGGRSAQAPVAPAARSIARDVLDAALWQAAAKAGADVRQASPATSLERAPDGHLARTGAAEHCARHVIDATGRWSRIRRQPSAAPSFLGLKAHFSGEPPSRAVELYFFKGGYCGVQMAAREELNVCALVSAARARTLAEVFALHPELRARSRDWRPAGEELATAPVMMRRPQPVSGGILRVGDAAGFLDPLFGDGISVALRSGVLAAECLCTGHDYAAAYRARFLPAFRGAQWARRLFAIPAPLRSLLWPLLERSPRLVAAFSRSTR